MLQEFSQSSDEQAVIEELLDYVHRIVQFQEEVSEMMTLSAEACLQAPSRVEACLGAKASCNIDAFHGRGDAEQQKSIQDVRSEADTVFQGIVHGLTAKTEEIFQVVKERLSKATKELQPIAKGKADGQSWRENVSAHPSVADLVALGASIMKGAFAVSLNEAFKKLRQECVDSRRSSPPPSEAEFPHSREGNEVPAHMTWIPWFSCCPSSCCLFLS